MWERLYSVARQGGGGRRGGGGAACACGRAAALGRVDGGAPLPGLPAVRRPRAAPRCGVARALAGAGRVAVRALHGHPLEFAETFVDPSRFRGACYDASNWVRVGRTKGFARHNGGYTDLHDCPKEMFVRALRADARTRLAAPADRPEWACRATPVRYTHEELRSLRGLFAEVPDSRRGQGRKHRLATVLSVCALARLAGQYGSAATERFARNLDQGLAAPAVFRPAEPPESGPVAKSPTPGRRCIRRAEHHSAHRRCSPPASRQREIILIGQGSRLRRAPPFHIIRRHSMHPWPNWIRHWSTKPGITGSNPVGCARSEHACRSMHAHHAVPVERAAGQPARSLNATSGRIPAQWRRSSAAN